ncbi:ribosome small subunit-dependent GTPase A [Calditrichota bacterium]
MNLDSLGWNSFFEKAYEEYSTDKQAQPARVARQNKAQYEVYCKEGHLTAQTSGAFNFAAESSTDFPTVGDWVVISKIPDEEKAIIHVVLPRKSAFTRKVAGTITDEQVIASNVDVIFIVTGLDNNYNLSRIERYLAQTLMSGTQPVILLNKADLCLNPQEKLAEVQAIAGTAPVHLFSAIEDTDLNFLLDYIDRGVTATLTGSSGVGKTTIINSFLESQLLPTQQISNTVGKGMHTTTWREMVLLPNGGIVIDTPGMRELQLWADDDYQPSHFEEIERIIGACHFRNCNHKDEPGCAIRAALEDGSLEERRWRSYQKMTKEIQQLEFRKNIKAKRNAKARSKAISKYSRQLKKMRAGRGKEW